MTEASGLPDPVTVPAEAGAKALRLLGAVAVVASAAATLGYFLEPRQFAFSYLWGLTFVTSISLGGLFWVMVHYLTAAGWSVVIRRFSENLTWGIPAAAVLFVPMILIVAYASPENLPYQWADVAGQEHNELWQRKQPWLSVNFFLGRLVFYFAIWILVSGLLRYWSTRQDVTREVKYSKWMGILSAPGMIALALSSSFFAFDWLMTLNYTWYSTMFGVYFWAGAIQSSMATLILMVLGMRRLGYLTHTITVEHTHDMGKLLFGFTVFWTYIAFGQYFLIWYANMPEETAWFIYRRGGWNTVSWGLFFGRFIIPFAWLLRRSQKRNMRTLGIGSAWIVGMQLYDQYWQIMPALKPDGPTFSWLDLLCPVAVISVVAWVVARAIVTRPLIPIGDPRLGESLHHKNYW